MKVKLYFDNTTYTNLEGVRVVGKAGEEVDAKEPSGSQLVSQGYAAVIAHDLPAANAPKAAVVAKPGEEKDGAE